MRLRTWTVLFLVVLTLTTVGTIAAVATGVAKQARKARSTTTKPPARFHGRRVGPLPGEIVVTVPPSRDDDVVDVAGLTPAGEPIPSPAPINTAGMYASPL